MVSVIMQILLRTIEHRLDCTEFSGDSKGDTSRPRQTPSWTLGLPLENTGLCHSVQCSVSLIPYLSFQKGMSQLKKMGLANS